MKKKWLIAAVCALTLVLTACSGGGQGETSEPPAETTEPASRHWEANVLRSDAVQDVNGDGILDFQDFDEYNSSSVAQTEASRVPKPVRGCLSAIPLQWKLTLVMRSIRVKQEICPMFYGCSSLTELTLGDGFVTTNADTYDMFEDCPAGADYQHLLND